MTVLVTLEDPQSWPRGEALRQAYRNGMLPTMSSETARKTEEQQNNWLRRLDWTLDWEQATGKTHRMPGEA
jgi:hypothetical protein